MEGLGTQLPIAGLLVDTLMDPVLTSTMLRELGPATGSWSCFLGCVRGESDLMEGL